MKNHSCIVQSKGQCKAVSALVTAYVYRVNTAGWKGVPERGVIYTTICPYKIFKTDLDTISLLIDYVC